MNEHIRLYKLDRKDYDLDDKALVYRSVQIFIYSIYCTMGYKPDDLLHNKVDKSVWHTLQKKKFMNKRLIELKKLMKIEKIVMNIQKEN